MRKMQGLMESCYAKTVMSGVMGFGLGGMFGAFMASVRPFFCFPSSRILSFLPSPSLPRFLFPPPLPPFPPSPTPSPAQRTRF